jgi:tetratricopeptide (TPR) repeat protein
MTAHDDPARQLELGIARGRETRWAEAAELLDAAVAGYRNGSAPDRRHGLPRALWRSALVQHQLDHTATALQRGREAVALWDDLLGRHPRRLSGAGDTVADAARCCIDLSVIAGESRLRDDQLRYGERAMELAEHLIQIRHPDAHELGGTAWHITAGAHLALRDHAKALRAATAAIELRELRSAGSVHPSLADWELANTLLLRSTAASALDRPHDAVDDATRAVEIAATLGRAGMELFGKGVAQIKELSRQHPGALAGREIHIGRLPEARVPPGVVPDWRYSDRTFRRGRRLGALLGIALGTAAGAWFGSWTGALVGLYCGFAGGLSIGLGAAGIRIARRHPEERPDAVTAFAFGLGAAIGSLVGPLLVLDARPSLGPGVAALLGFAVGGTVLGGFVGSRYGRARLPLAMAVIPTAAVGLGLWAGEALGALLGWPVVGGVAAAVLAFVGWSVSSTAAARAGARPPAGR